MGLKVSIGTKLSLTLLAALAAAVGLVFAAGSSLAQVAPSVGFVSSPLKGDVSSLNPTSLQFGPDGRLYVAQQDGAIKAYTVKKNGYNDYSVAATETITAVQAIPNHNDDGTPNTTLGKRQVTGILVKGTAASPVIYASSSDPRIGGNDAGTDTNLDTNSGVVSKLTKTATGWARTDLVVGLPRSEENHSVNGMQMSGDGKFLYMTVGGNTNQGAPSNHLAYLPEFALSAAIVKIDLAAIGNTTHKLATLDDPNRAGNPDAGDPFGGNDGANQAKADAKVQVYSPGYRNAYDLVIAQSGKMYTVDNGGNADWGSKPVGVNTPDCTNDKKDGGFSNKDNFHHVAGQGYYGGHPNPTRGNKANVFAGQSPIGAANPVECNYVKPSGTDIRSFPASTNGLAEYTASAFGGAMEGDLLAASFDGKIYRIELNAAGTAVAKKSAIAENFGNSPLDVTAQGDGGPFPGTVWAAVYGPDTIQVFEPNSNSAGCTGADDPALDEDGDGYDNADEIDSGTLPCSAASRPDDNDGDKTSDKTDPDDDNDGIADTSDPFAVDKNNGKTTQVGVRYGWKNDVSRCYGGLEGDFCFTGLMLNPDKAVDYKTQYYPAEMTVGGIAGLFTVDKVQAGDAYAKTNTQKYAFQSGVNVASEAEPYTAHTRILTPFAERVPASPQSMGMFIGTGDQDNYIKLVVAAKDGTGGIEFAREEGGAFQRLQYPTVPMPGPAAVDLYLTVDPKAKTVQASYAVTAANGVRGQRVQIGGPAPVPADWLDGPEALAFGFISRSASSTDKFSATWEFVEVVRGNGDAPPPAADKTAPQTTLTSGPSGTTRSRASSFAFSSNEPGSRFQCSLDGAPWSACASPKSYAGLLDGGHGFRVRAIDAAGNVDASPAARSWRIDATKPTIKGIRPRSNATTQDRTPRLSAVVRDSGSNLRKVNIRLSVDGKRVTRFSYDAARDRLQYVPPRALKVGKHSATVVAKDAAGNRAAKTWSFKVVRAG